VADGVQGPETFSEAAGEGASSNKGVGMKSIADALVYATTFINLSAADHGEEYSDDAVAALESIAGYLSAATEAEKDALAEAARRLLAQEKNSAHRAEFVEDYTRWMEDMFGEEWKDNRRV